MNADEFREQHDGGDYTTWTDETYDLYFALIAANATPITGLPQQPTGQKAPA